MGALCGKSLSAEEEAERQRSRALERGLKKSAEQEMQVNRLLLLGAGESGKSTLFKQMINIYGAGFNERELATYVSTIHNNIVSSMHTLLAKNEELSQTRGVPTVADREAARRVAEHSVQVAISESLAADIAALWEDPGLQATYELRSTFQLTDSTDYFMGRVREVADPAYLPTKDDVLRSRVRTTGIVEEQFDIEGNKFQMFDVGGQRNERRKWIHCFSEVTAVLFVAALSAYDLVLFEDETTNRMIEALNLFNEICNSTWFSKTSMILLLNKKDLFFEKIQRVPLSVCFPEYAEIEEQGPTADDACEYIRDQFLARNMSATRAVYTHFTCATDTRLMRPVFTAVKDIVIRKSLQEGGLLS